MNSTAMAGSKNDGIFALLEAAHALEDKVADALGQVGLSMPKYAVLNELVTMNRPVALSELATRLSCVKSNMTQLIDRLEGEGLVQRVDDPADRRSVKAAITATGVAKQAAGAAALEKLQDAFAAAVGTDDRAAVGRMLNALK